MHSHLFKDQLKLRPATVEDALLLFEIYASTRVEEMALVPWTSEQQHAFLKMQFESQQNYYAEKYPGASHDIIYLGGKAVGRIYVARLENEIRIVDVTLLLQHRGNGVGTYLITQLINEATTKVLPLRIYLETFNRSLKLFERLGFRQTTQQGMHILMEWMPVPA
ncbi:MAG TPA: GNAT family N-acetyltransferase [Pyrinomonadaceae bacterium]